MKNDSGSNIWDIVKAISVLALVGVTTYKVASSNTNIEVDFSNFLALVLALFSMYLSALFYFKASESSAEFYDNTYKFTKDIAELLVKIDSGFGERLKSLDEGYTAMRNYFQGSSSEAAQEVKDTKKKIETEQSEIAKTVEERDRLVKELIEKSTLAKHEKDNFSSMLTKKESELELMRNEVTHLKKKLFAERLSNRNSRDNLAWSIDQGMAEFTRHAVINKIGSPRIKRITHGALRREFSNIEGDLPRAYIEDLSQHGLYDEGLTMRGIKFIKDLAVDA